MTDRVMLDLETLGTEPGCAILSIGAVAFDREEIGAEIHRRIDVETCLDAGLEIDGETLAWWFDDDRDPQVRQDAFGGRVSLLVGLSDLAALANSADEIWAKSPAFDCAILEAAYDALDIATPWEYWETRDVRTATALVDVEVKRDGPAHDALADAKYQARQVQQVLRELEALESDLDMTAVAAEVAQDGVDLKNDLRDLIEKWSEHGSPADQACAKELEAVLREADDDAE